MYDTGIEMGMKKYMVACKVFIVLADDTLAKPTIEIFERDTRYICMQHSSIS